MNFHPLHWLTQICALGFVFAAAVSCGAEVKIPETFLPAEGKLHAVLQTGVSGTFQAVPAREAIAALCRQLPVNHVYERANPKPVATTFSGTFKDTPFRTALFQIARTTHITVEWAERPDGGKLLRVRE